MPDSYVPVSTTPVLGAEETWALLKMIEPGNGNSTLPFPTIQQPLESTTPFSSGHTSGTQQSPAVTMSDDWSAYFNNPVAGPSLWLPANFSDVLSSPTQVPSVGPSHRVPQWHEFPLFATSPSPPVNLQTFTPESPAAPNLSQESGSSSSVSGQTSNSLSVPPPRVPSMSPSMSKRPRLSLDDLGRRRNLSSSSSVAPSPYNGAGSSSTKPTGYRRHLQPAVLTPIDAPTQKRNYAVPLVTSRKGFPPSAIKSLASPSPRGSKRSSAAAGLPTRDDAEHADNEGSTGSDHTDADDPKQAIEGKRRTNTIAAPPPTTPHRQLSYGVRMSNFVDPQEITLRAVLGDLAHFVIPPSRLTIFHSSQVGSGGYGEVVLAKLDGSDASVVREVAVKQFRTVGTNGVRIRVALRLARELKIWAEVKHPNILGLVGYYLSENYEIAQLISPFMVNGNVLRYIAELRPDMNKRLDFAQDITAGMDYLHSHDPPICHGDLKPANVLIDDYANAILCDLGLASVAGEAQASSGLTTSRSLKGSTRYMSPELLMEKETKQTLASDVWAWACTVFQILTDVEPYSDAKAEWGVIAAILQNKPPGDLTILSTGILGESIEGPRLLPDHLGKCWSFEPAERPSIATIPIRGYLHFPAVDDGRERAN